MKIATWNVNSIRAREDQVLDWIEQADPDVLCLQETKITDQEFPEEGFGDLGYDVEYFGQRTYNGVAIVSRDVMEKVVRGFPDDDPKADKRLIAATINGIRVINIYLPNGREVDGDHYRFKLEWIERLHRFLDEEAKNTEPVLICGDYNIAPLDIDTWNPEERQGHLFVSEPERAGFQKLLDWGLVDSFRHFHKEEDLYSWWDYRGGAWERNRGMRIDHMLVTETLLERTERVTIDKEVRSNEKASDHVPVVIETR